MQKLVCLDRHELQRQPDQIHIGLQRDRCTVNSAAMASPCNPRRF